MPLSSERLNCFCSGHDDPSEIISWNLFDGDIDAEKEQQRLRKRERTIFSRIHRWYEERDQSLSLLSDPLTS